MVKALANRTPVVLENPKHVGDYIQLGNGPVDFYNMFDAHIILGEPIIVYGRVGITKRIVDPLTVGSFHVACWMNFLVDPALANPILYGDKMYYDLDLADEEVPGYVTNVEPAMVFTLVML